MTPAEHAAAHPALTRPWCDQCRQREAEPVPPVVVPGVV